MVLGQAMAGGDSWELERSSKIGTRIVMCSSVGEGTPQLSHRLGIP